MNSSISGTLAGLIVGVLTATGYFGLLGLMAVESACIPLPSEIILPFAGFLVAQGKMNLFVAATIGALGCNVGSAIAYAVGEHGGRSAIERWGRYVLINRHDINKAERFFERFGSGAVLIGRMLPVIRTFIAFPAGIARMPKLKFHIYTFVGSWPWCLLLTYIGMTLGDRWNSSSQLATIFHYADYAIAMLLIGMIARFIYVRRRASS